MEETKKRVRFILNPYSGVKDNEAIKIAINQHFDKNKYIFEIVETEYAGHATNIAIDALKEGFQMIVAVGGDGSVNEIATALVGSQIPLGVLPAGSGNGFAMHLGMGRDIVKAIELLNKGKEKKMDVCYINDKPFVNIAGLGFDGAIAYKYKRTTRRGFWGYLKFALSETLSYQFQEYYIKVDDKVYNEKLLSLSVANGPMYGYNFTIAPNAKIDSGEMEVVMIKKAPKWRYFFTIYRMLNKTLDKSSLVKTFKAQKIEFICPTLTYAHVDGEGFSIEGKAVFKIEPKKLNIICPDY